MSNYLQPAYDPAGASKSDHQRYIEEMERGSNALREATQSFLIARRYNLPPPPPMFPGFLWTYQGEPGGVDYAPQQRPEPIAKRDPCPKCGTRMDIGCKHHPVAA